VPANIARPAPGRVPEPETREGDMGAILTLIVIVIVGAVAWWLLRKVIHFGFLIALGLVVLFGWWFFFVR
jgi:hypothetical protein